MSLTCLCCCVSYLPGGNTPDSFLSHLDRNLFSCLLVIPGITLYSLWFTENLREQCSQENTHRRAININLYSGFLTLWVHSKKVMHFSPYHLHDTLQKECQHYHCFIKHRFSNPRRVTRFKPEQRSLRRMYSHVLATSKGSFKAYRTLREIFLSCHGNAHGMRLLNIKLSYCANINTQNWSVGNIIFILLINFVYIFLQSLCHHITAAVS